MYHSPIGTKQALHIGEIFILEEEMTKVRELVAKSYSPKPSISFDVKTLPQIKDWKVGGKYRLVIDVEQVSASKDDYDFDSDSDSGKLSARFKVLKVKEAKNDKS
jgi:hypothetical protein